MQLIDENNPLPLYHQLQEILREKVVSGEWLPGSQIPTEIQLMETFGVSSSTVRNAILELVRTGRIRLVQTDAFGEIRIQAA